jgi:aldose 1-epimerase
MPSGEVVDAWTLVNRHGTTLSAITLGATITSLVVADRDGRPDDVVLGMSDLRGYLTQSPYFGAVAGRLANRIAHGRFTLDGVTYQLATNNGPNHLHGGVVGFDKRLWTAERVRNDSGVAVRFNLTSRDGNEGYPGMVRASVRYLLTDDDRLIIDYRATTTRPTVVNLTQHSYFNLAGRLRGDILGHELRINADRFTPVDSTLIPTGELSQVDGTPFDYRIATPIGARIDADHQQIRYGKGYDHNFVLQRSGPGLEHAATVYEPLSGRTLDVWTTEPGLQLYTGNFLDGTIVGKEQRIYRQHAGFCLETQHFPDSPNHPLFPSVVLRPGGRYQSRTVYAFGVRR